MNILILTNKLLRPIQEGFELTEKTISDLINNESK